MFCGTGPDISDADQVSNCVLCKECGGEPEIDCWRIKIGGVKNSSFIYLWRLYCNNVRHVENSTGYWDKKLDAFINWDLNQKR